MRTTLDDAIARARLTFWKLMPLNPNMRSYERHNGVREAFEAAMAVVREEMSDE